MKGNEKRRRQDDKGQSIVEFVLILPVIAILLAGLIDLGRAYFAYVAVTDAAAEGAAFAALLVHREEDLHDVTCPPTDVEDPSEDSVCRAAREAVHGTVRLDEAEIIVRCPTCPTPTSGDPVTVTVVYPFRVTTPIVEAMIPGSVLPLRAVASQAIALTTPHE